MMARLLINAICKRLVFCFGLKITVEYFSLSSPWKVGCSSSCVPALISSDEIFHHFNLRRLKIKGINPGASPEPSQASRYLPAGRQVKPI